MLEHVMELWYQTMSNDEPRVCGICSTDIPAEDELGGDVECELCCGSMCISCVCECCICGATICDECIKHGGRVETHGYTCPDCVNDEPDDEPKKSTEIIQVNSSDPRLKGSKDRKQEMFTISRKKKGKNKGKSRNKISTFFQHQTRSVVTPVKVKTLQEVMAEEEESFLNRQLRFSPYAWAKMRYFRDKGNTEISGFGIAEGPDLLHIDDFITIKQDASAAHFEFDDSAVSDFLTDQVEKGLQPRQCMRVWIHTHPSDDSTPSCVDNRIFRDKFGSCDWAILCIMGTEDSLYARMRFNVGPKGDLRLKHLIDLSPPFKGVDLAAWDKEFEENINSSSELDSDIPSHKIFGASDITTEPIGAGRPIPREVVQQGYGIPAYQNTYNPDDGTQD